MDKDEKAEPDGASSDGERPPPPSDPPAEPPSSDPTYEDARAALELQQATPEAEATEGCHHPLQSSPELVGDHGRARRLAHDGLAQSVAKISRVGQRNTCVRQPNRLSLRQATLRNLKHLPL